MQAVEQKNQWKSRAVISAVAGAHILAASALVFLYGCSTPKPPAKVEPPATPIMPPTKEPSPVVEKTLVPPPPPVELAPPAKESTAAKTYVVQPGDSISKIAHRSGVSTREILELNGIKNANLVRVGQKLMLPAYAKELPAGKVKATTTARKGKKGSAAAKSATGTAAVAGAYVVKPGDSLDKIARKNGVKVGALKEANKLSSDKIRVGQKLVIPGKGGGEAAPTPEAPAGGAAAPAPETPAGAMAPAPVPTAMLDYTVQEGETVDSVAKTFLVKKEDILKANGATDPAQIRAGTRIKIPVPAQ